MTQLLSEREVVVIKFKKIIEMKHFINYLLYSVGVAHVELLYNLTLRFIPIE